MSVAPAKVLVEPDIIGVSSEGFFATFEPFWINAAPASKEMSATAIKTALGDALSNMLKDIRRHEYWLKRQLAA